MVGVQLYSKEIMRDSRVALTTENCTYELQVVIESMAFLAEDIFQDANKIVKVPVL